VNGLGVAVRVEVVKAWASPVVRITTALLLAGVTVLAAAMSWAADRGNEQVTAQLGPFAESSGWERYLGVAAQVVAAGGLLALGVVLSWSTGREFIDRTVSGLYALPVARPTIVCAKLIVHVAWSAVAGSLLVGALFAVGLALGLGWPDPAAMAAQARIFVLLVLSSVLVVPAGWVVTVSRSLLAGVGTVVGIIVLAQVAVVAGGGAWLPFVAPALWAVEPAAVSPAQLALGFVVPLAFGAGTVRAWAEMELDR